MQFFHGAETKGASNFFMELKLKGQAIFSIKVTQVLQCKCLSHETVSELEYVLQYHLENLN
jgi:hypothetical protein